MLAGNAWRAAGAPLACLGSTSGSAVIVGNNCCRNCGDLPDRGRTALGTDRGLQSRITHG